MSSKVERWGPLVAYPAVLTGGIALHLAMVGAGVPFLWSTYVPVFLGAAAVTGLELRIPHCKEWMAVGDDVRNDLLFMVVVQMVLPKVLSFLVAVSIMDWVAASSLDLRRLWPHQWPLGVQVVLMVLIADFLRYWFHVLSHNHPFFWRFHAVHHSPEKLYWLNVGRFHPIEKAIQFLLDALPFILVGVAREVVSTYFVFYALNGFFQHSNVEVRLGFLNYLISGAELHRWHHSRVVEESNSNYGNNTIVWDVLFRTRFLPRDREITDLGLARRDYPKEFLAQLKTPFRPELLETETSSGSEG